ncbi:MAG: type II toxin-antitoxin system VapC family toxin [Pseudomonadales bacterium]|nr:type II toxin-antitoxin system VapC family toxin [Pseudomonadales bacterium]
MIVLDTCAIIWDALEPNKLTHKAKVAIEKADQDKTLIISDISIWEISMLIQRNRLEVNTTAMNFVNLFLESRNIIVQQISPEIAELSVGFGTEINNDPADRIIVATSIIQNAKLVTADSNLRNSKLLEVIW